ncbi:deoxyribose-phosphate aldolase [Serpentinicella sp. ANB-PHB4]|uniref:deoxyribose-phosphate aldolase n=1 Tax=Serpentinicella sp. ANB-PHB4 TaxID=3074076 RepID=UPI0028675C6C|nr:deoxyribose-phosphate aldolase [Serpentinicella sp. ANB-PHB4]MDR5658018.1 deoxyribose-phosphate aldolase [Serpentinicella sp. ANB-PHB4]
MIKDIAKYIDHTVLKAETTENEIKRYCDEAKQYGFYSVCINSANVEFVANQLKNSHVKVTSVVGFPLGASSTESKAFETTFAVKKGADEIDMVINIGKLKEGDTDFLLNDIKSVVEAANGAIVKVIIETALLTEEEKIQACKISKSAGAHFVKTSTGFSTAGANIEDIKLMREVVGPDLGVKASGGVRTLENATALIDAGASRIGASASVNIVLGTTDNNSKGY